MTLQNGVENALMILIETLLEDYPDLNHRSPGGSAW